MGTLNGSPTLAQLSKSIEAISSVILHRPGASPPPSTSSLPIFTTQDAKLPLAFFLSLATALSSYDASPASAPTRFITLRARAIEAREIDCQPLVSDTQRFAVATPICLFVCWSFLYEAEPTHPIRSENHRPRRFRLLSQSLDRVPAEPARQASSEAAQLDKAEPTIASSLITASNA